MESGDEDGGKGGREGEKEEGEGKGEGRKRKVGNHVAPQWYSIIANHDHRLIAKKAFNRNRSIS